MSKEIIKNSGLIMNQTFKGDGEKPSNGQQIVVHYEGYLEDGNVFDSSVQRGQPFTFNLGGGNVIKGWDEAFLDIGVGDKWTLIIPPELAYGNRSIGAIPSNSTLIFDVELLEVK